MRLHVCNCNGVPNFGDQLNHWLWPKVLPELSRVVSSGLFLGIGTVLNTKIPQSDHYTVFGAGAGYGDPPVVDDRWRIFFVRGPLTADALGIDRSKAITDPAALVRRFWKTKRPHKGTNVSFMAHYASERAGRWGSIAEELGLNVIDATAECEVVISEIADSSLLVTDAMHGAIVADSLRVPWVPLAVYKHTVAAKWNDWCASMRLTYKPYRLSKIWHPAEHATRAEHLAWWTKRQLAKSQLRRLATPGQAVLSDIDTLESRIEMIDTQIKNLRELLQQASETAIEG